MDIFNDMKKYWKGKTPEGYDKFSIPLKPDEDDMIGRECPNEDCQPRYFKIYLHESEKAEEEKEMKVDKEDLSQINLTCPYCGRIENMQQFHTKPQTQYIESMITRDVHYAFQETLKKAFPLSRPKADKSFSVRMEFKPGPLPGLKHYTEKQLKRKVVCNKCGHKYAVYGIAFHCPFCGEGNILIHFEISKQIVLSSLNAGDVMREKGGEEAYHHHLGNCLEDIVSLFEGFHKSFYIKTFKNKASREEAEEKISRIKTNFQRLSGAEEFFRIDLGIEIFAPLSDKEREFLEEIFLKRHVITHNLGLVDKKFQEKVRSWQGRGEELEISKSDIEKGLELVDKVIREEVRALGLHD